MRTEYYIAQVRHSERRATTGSTVAARRAGTKLASSAAADKIEATAMRVGMSHERTPKSTACIAAAAPMAHVESDEYADAGEAAGFAEDEAIDGALLSAERHADADFARALADGVGDDAVEADDAEDQSERGESADEPSG